MSNEIKAAKNVQRNAYQITINNPIDKGYTHRAIKEELTTSFTTLRYFCMADEIGEQGTYHTHIYVVFTSRVRWSKIKKSFPEAHIVFPYGTAENNLEYIKKSGKWENTEKAETRVEGTFEEWGTFPTQKGEKPEMEELYEMVKNGYSNAQILEINNDYILQIDKLDKLRTMLLTEKYKDTRRMDLKVTYIYGATGTGKTRGVLDEHGDSNVYRVCDYRHPFDGYNCQPVIAFDEYRSQLRLSDMLQYCDIYPIELSARYSNKFACYETVYIISNWSLEQQYEQEQKESPESWQAFLRRIHEVIVYHEDKTITTYDSMEKYLHRNEQFHEVSNKEKAELPF
ncbi:hypothetical protein [Roseburia sp. 499]|uniref:hypothetical protein n=1 Tax=Roseburia sp. 499 TaxID=1261634 RepID=UPI0009522F3A|nr:hypothetical protein [Roseburia sp. 499]WVK69502.1 hypothetical protein BIV20_14240 [Roseburia sp. 499]